MTTATATATATATTAVDMFDKYSGFYQHDRVAFLRALYATEKTTFKAVTVQVRMHQRKAFGLKPNQRIPLDGIGSNQLRGSVKQSLNQIVETACHGSIEPTEIFGCTKKGNFLDSAGKATAKSYSVIHIPSGLAASIQDIGTEKEAKLICLALAKLGITSFRAINPKQADAISFVVSTVQECKKEIFAK